MQNKWFFYSGLVLAMIPSFVLADEPVKDITMQSLNSADATASLLKVVVGLTLVLGAIFASAWFFKRFTRIGTVSTDSLKIVGGLALGNRERLIVLKVGDEQLLLGVTPGRIEKIHVLEKPLDVSVPASSGKFSDKLAAALTQQKS